MTTYPRLTHLELHRYRGNRDQAVDHVRPLLHIAFTAYMLTSTIERLQRRIATQLSELRSLRTIHLPLDFTEDHGAYCVDETARCAWFQIL